MEQNPHWEADSRLGNKEVPHLLWNPKVHYRVHKSQLLESILSQMNPIHALTPYSSEIRFNIILPSTSTT
jgi:hypothetical protein